MQRLKPVAHPFGTMKARIGTTHFLVKTLPKVASEMALNGRRDSDRCAVDCNDGRCR